MANIVLYQPLDKTREEFRLLRIQPSDDFHSIITCQLFTVSFAKKPSYSALSYEWGNCKVTEPALINGITVQITSNLEAALRRIRISHPEVILWVDALCINQNDLAEKNVQVAMMGRLYSNTILTYAWLGEDHDHIAARTFQFLRYFLGDFGKFIENTNHFAIKASKGVCRNNKTHCELENKIIKDIRRGNLATEESNINDFHKLCRRNYWWRTWVQQELVLSPKVLLLSGSASISLNSVIAFALLGYVIRTHAIKWTESSDTVSHMLRIRWVPHVVQLVLTGLNDLVALMSRLQSCRVTNPRDKIYGILGIYHGAVTITVNYDKPVAQVFGDLVRTVAEESGRLYLRQFPRNTVDPHVPALPSWTPDFLRNAIAYTATNGTGIHGSGGLNARIYSASCPSLLRTIGCPIDTVQSVFRFSWEHEASDVLRNFIGSYIGMPHPTGTPFLQVLCCNIFQYPTIESLERTSAMTNNRMFLHWILKRGMERGAFNERFDNFVRDQNLVDVFESVPEEISRSLQFAQITGAIDHLVEPYKNAQDHSKFLRMTPQQRMVSFWGSTTYPESFLADIDWQVPSTCAVLEWMTMKLKTWINKEAIIITEQGYTGFATYDASVGDRICVVAGCPWPAIIRPSGNCHEIVGGSFIFGMMNGELFKDGRLTDDRQQIFEFV